MTPPINKDINSLSPEFKKRFDLWRAEVLSKYQNAVVFECRRSQERQNWLYAQGRTRPGKIVTRTLNSNHRDGNAVDIVFNNNGKLERSGPYDALIEIAKRFGIKNLKPKETCHFELDPSFAGFINTPIQKSDPEMQSLIEDGIRDGNLGSLDFRTMKIIGRVYNKLK